MNYTSMKKEIVLKRYNGSVNGQQASVLAMDSNYFNLKHQESLLENSILLVNESSSLQIQLDLQLAPSVFIIGFDDDFNKVGISVNFNSSTAPFSLMLAEKCYLIVPFDKSFKPEQIISFSFGV